MHIRQKKMERADVRYVIDNVEIPLVSQYKYLGCVIDEHLELNDMVEEKAMAGKKALGAWFSRCRVELGDIGVGTFRKLMTSLVESTMLYGAEIWGCNRNIERVEHADSVESLENVLWCRNTTSQSFSVSRDGGPTREMAS